MVCEWCRKAAATGDFNMHSQCPGKRKHVSHCDCQHKKTRAMIEAEVSVNNLYGQAVDVPLVEIRLPARRGARASKCPDCGKAVAHKQDGTLYRHKDTRNGKWGPWCWGSGKPASCDCEEITA